MTVPAAHGHGPGLGARADRRRLALVLTITGAVLLADVVGARLTGSLALLPDAGHLLTDAAGLVMALLAAHLVMRPPTSRRTWGYQRAETLAAPAQALLLLGVGGYVFVEGIRRLFEPSDVASTAMLVRPRLRHDGERTLTPPPARQTPAVRARRLDQGQDSP